MRRVIATLCCLIVFAELVIGLLVAIVVACLLLVGPSWPGNAGIEFHVGKPAEPPLPSTAMMSAPAFEPAGWTPPQLPGKSVPAQQPSADESPIVSLRAEHGGLLAGTVLNEQVGAAAEQEEFVAALRHIAAAQDAPPAVLAAVAAPHEHFAGTATSGMANSETLAATQALEPADASREDATRFAVRQLYAMAEMDEQVGEFSRADQWRFLARQLREEKVNGRALEDADATTLAPNRAPPAGP